MDAHHVRDRISIVLLEEPNVPLPTPLELERYLHEHIPLTNAMQVSAVKVSEDSVELRAPLAPNINHRETVFGGSASALAILAAWGLVYVRLNAANVSARLVIQRNTMEYTKPVSGEFSARSMLAEPEEWPRFLKMLERKGKARVTVTSILEFNGEEAGRLSGEFVALGNK